MKTMSPEAQKQRAKLRRRRLAAMRAKQRGDWTWEDEELSREDWGYNAVNGCTQLGYFDWVRHNLEE